MLENKLFVETASNVPLHQIPALVRWLTKSHCCCPCQSKHILWRGEDTSHHEAHPWAQSALPGLSLPLSIPHTLVKHTYPEIFSPLRNSLFLCLIVSSSTPILALHLSRHTWSPSRNLWASAHSSKHSTVRRKFSLSTPQHFPLNRRCLPCTTALLS